MQTTYHDTKPAAEAEAARVGGTVVDASYEAFILPASFFEAIRNSPQPAMALVRAHAERYYAGNLEAGWDDAVDGEIRGVSASVCSGIDQRMRQRVKRERWMVRVEAPSRPEVETHDPQDDHVGWGLGDD